MGKPTVKPAAKPMDIRLRPTRESDIPAVLKMERDPANTPYIRQWHSDQHLSSLSSAHYGHFMVENDTGQVMGYIILTGLDNPDKSIEFKRIVIRQKGNGFGKKAILLVKKMVFEELGAHRLWLEVLPENKRAAALYAALGFIKEGVHRESLKVGDEYFSLIVMSQLSYEAPD